jgi:hypothetical protein
MTNALLYGLCPKRRNSLAGAGESNTVFDSCPSQSRFPLVTRTSQNNQRAGGSRSFRTVKNSALKPTGAVIRVYDAAGNETHEHAGDFKKW